MNPLFKVTRPEIYLFETLNTIIQYSQQAVLELRRILMDSSYSDYTKIAELEDKCDTISYNLNLWILDGNIAPVVLNSVGLLIDKTDDVLDYTRYLAKEISRARKRKEKLCQPLPELNQMLSLILDALNILADIFTSKNLTLETIKTKRGVIETLENKGDDIKETAFDFIYSVEMDWYCFSHLEKLIQGLDDILDTCEDVADFVLQFIVAVSS